MLPEIKFTLSSIKVALDVGSALIKADSGMDKALLKFELTKLMDALMEAKQTVRELDELAYEKDKLIKKLTEQLNNKESTVGFLEARYYVGENGEPTGKPFCPTCWSSNGALSPLVQWSTGKGTKKCGKCGNTVVSRRCPQDAEYFIKSQREASKTIGGMEYEVKTFP